MPSIISDHGDCAFSLFINDYNILVTDFDLLF